MNRACYVCQSSTEELRPYGEGGRDICFDCMIASPEREEEARKNFGALLNATAVIGDGIVVIGEDDGPIPFKVPA